MLTRDGLWVPDQLCGELHHRGLGAEVAPLLERTEPLPKAARSLSVDRPTAQRNYETLRARAGLRTPSEIFLVDDMVTAGATLLGSASRLAEVYPDVPIRAFAAARTVSVAAEFERTADPVHGTTVLRANGRTQRDP
jgi:hypothetical protein